jgi:hypothetical protein
VSADTPAPELEDESTLAWKALGMSSGTSEGSIGYGDLHRAAMKGIRAARREMLKKGKLKA